MPFSWKKKNRFSRLVADHLQSPKRGSSLVVETGFPTSLIDLYVRNRGRFRKSAVMKSPENESLSSSLSSGLLIDSVNLSSSSSLISLLDSNNSDSYDHKEINEIIEEEIEDLNSSEIDAENSFKLHKSNSLPGCYDYKENDEFISSEIDIKIENSSEYEVETSVELAKSNPVFVALLKVLIMLVLVLGTKRFTFGITVFAFLLFFLESLTKTFLTRSSLVDSKTPIESSFRSKNTSRVVCSELEIQVRSEKELDKLRSDDIMEVRRKSSRRAIMKSRMKKLVPKKLRRSSKEDETVKRVHDVKPLVFSSQCSGSDSKGENLSVLKQEYDEILGKKRSLSLTYSSEIHSNDNKLRNESLQNSGYLVLCVIVLVGLIGGRVLAVSLALSWCLILKTLQLTNVKFFVL